MTDRLTAIVAAQVSEHDRYREAVEEPWTYPSQAFERKAGITGIARDYAMPGGKDPKALYIAIARTEAEYELLSGYRRLAEGMGGLSPENWQAQAVKLQAAQTAFRKELEQLWKTGTLDEVEDKVYEGYVLRAQGKAMAGLRELMEAGCDGETLVRFCSQAQQAMERTLDATYAALEALNPELSVLTPQIDTQIQKRFVVLGVLSKYNVADIKSFSIDGNTYREVKNDPKWVRQWDEIQRRTGGELDGWIPAKSTQMRILDQLRQHDRLEAAAMR